MCVQECVSMSLCLPFNFLFLWKCKYGKLLLKIVNAIYVDMVQIINLCYTLLCVVLLRMFRMSHHKYMKHVVFYRNRSVPYFICLSTFCLSNLSNTLTFHLSLDRNKRQTGQLWIMHVFTPFLICHRLLLSLLFNWLIDSGL